MERFEKLILAGLVLFVVVTVSFAVGLAWYQSGLQTKQYERQGIEITHWEVFNGVKPNEQTIRVKE